MDRPKCTSPGKHTELHAGREGMTRASMLSMTYGSKNNFQYAEVMQELLVLNSSHRNISSLIS